MKNHSKFQHRDGRIREATTPGQAVRMRFEGWTEVPAGTDGPAAPASDVGTGGQDSPPSAATSTPAETSPKKTPAPKP
jgi:hypothetical protein